MRWLSAFDKDALIEDNRHITFSQLAYGILETARRLAPHIQTGDRVAIIGGNSPEWAMALYGTWQAGAIAVPIDVMSTPEDVAYVLEDCKPSAVWCDTAWAKTLEAMKPTLRHLPAMMHLETLEPLSRQGEVTQAFESDDDALALIIYTSGTTGLPKGVMLTFGNLRSNSDSCCQQIQVFLPQDRVLALLPLHHAYPLMATLVMPLTIGATIVFCPKLNAATIMETLQAHQCTFLCGVPRLLELFHNSIMRQINASLAGRLVFRLCRAIGSKWLSKRVFAKVHQAFGGHIRYFACGGAAVEAAMLNDFYTLGITVLEGYGMTETSPMICFTPPNWHKAGSPGRPIPGNEVRIQDGEILVRGKNVMRGYYNKPEETRQALDDDGWLHTGDTGYIDKDGFIFLTGRTKELIILGNGKNINPLEIEEKLGAKSGGLFQEWAVSDDGRHLTAVVLPDFEQIKTRKIVNVRQTIMDEVIEPLNEALPSYKRLNRLEIVTTPLPRTRLGKLRRHILQQMLANGDKKAKGTKAKDTKDEQQIPTSKTYRELSEIIAKMTGRTVGPDEHLELEAGMDSLAKVTLAGQVLSHFNVSLPAAVFADCPTPRLMAEAIERLADQKAPEDNTTPDKDERHPQDGTQPLSRPSWTHRLYRFILSLLLPRISKLTIASKAPLPEGGCIFAANHLSILDALFICIALPPKRLDNTYFYVIAKYIDGPLSRRFARHHNMIPMEINGNLEQSLQKLSQLLKDGKSLGIFPEGTRSMDGTTGDFYPTFAALAVKTGAPIVPVAINGTYQMMPRGRIWPAWGTAVSITFLPPIQPDTADADALCQQTRDAIERELKR